MPILKTRNSRHSSYKNRIICLLLWELQVWVILILTSCVHQLLNDVSLRLAVMHFPVEPAVLHVLQLQSEGSYVLLALQKEDPSSLVHTRRLTDPHAALPVAHTWRQ